VRQVEDGTPWIREKVARDRARVKQRIDEEAPSWLAWALKPVAGLVFDQTRQRDTGGAILSRTLGDTGCTSW